MIITFSGIDCGGKTTQIDKLTALCQEKGMKVRYLWSRGGYTPGIELVKKLFFRRKQKVAGKTDSAQQKIEASQKLADSPKGKMLLWASIVDLAFYYGIWLRFLSVGRVVVCDRYLWDSEIDFRMKFGKYDYSGWGSRKFLEHFSAKPAASLMLTIPAEESVRRSSLKDEPFPEPVEVRRRRIGMYMDEVENGRWDHVIDATVPADEVFSMVMDSLSAHPKIKRRLQLSDK